MYAILKDFLKILKFFDILKIANFNIFGNSCKSVKPMKISDHIHIYIIYKIFRCMSTVNTIIIVKFYTLSAVVL